MIPVVRLLRPKQWTKNLLVFAAFIFAGKYTDPVATREVLLAFLAMCMVSSATYIANDLADRQRDAEHPVKRNRPLASGAISPAVAVVLAVVLLLTGTFVAWVVEPWTVSIIGGYIVVQVLYNAWLKSVAVADVFAIATGFVLRAILGAQAIHVPISGWLLFCTAALALMLGFAKRRQEFISMGDDRTRSRESLAGYTRGVLDVFVATFAGVAVMAYGIYSLQSPTATAYPGLLITVPFVLYGVSRYLYIVFTKNEGAEPAEILLKDGHVIFSVVGFVVASVVAIAGLEIPIVN